MYDDLDWIHDLTAWVREVHRADVPTLGSCWGHQVLAQSLGGPVVHTGEHELGYRTVSWRGDDPLGTLPGCSTTSATWSAPTNADQTGRTDIVVQTVRYSNTSE